MKSTILLFIFSQVFFINCIYKKESKFDIEITGDFTKFSILTFNILSKIDFYQRTQGYQPWMFRKKEIFQYINKLSPSLASLQENTEGQLNETINEFGNRYYFIYFSQITFDTVLMVKKEQFKVLNTNYWFLGKITDGIPRIAIWSILEDRHTGKQLVFVGTHLDGNRHNVEQMNFVNQKIVSNFNLLAPIFIAGDFNLDSKREEIKNFISSGWNDSAIIPNDNVKYYTYPQKNPNRRIDHIFYRGSGIKVISWKIDPYENKLILSDHLPVFGEFSINASK